MDEAHNFIVTGGCGFIGSHLVEALVLHGQNVLVIDDMRKGDYKIDYKNVEYLHQDVATAIPIGKYDAVFHLAATPRIRYSQTDPFGTITNNINSTMVVAEYARREGIPLFFAASSSTQFVHHQSNPYTFSKTVSEEILQLYHEQYGRNKTRDFTHIHDVVDGMIKLLTTKNKPREVHFGSGNPHSILEIANAFNHSKIHEFDKPGEAEATECLRPYIESQYDVIRYIENWKNDFDEEKILRNIDNEFNNVDEKYAKIDSRQ